MAECRHDLSKSTTAGLMNVANDILDTDSMAR